MRYILAVIICLGMFSSCGTNSELVRTGAFYDIAPRFLRSQGSKDYFRAYGKGTNEKECRINASSNLVKALVYEGSREGISIPPILNEPKAVAAFKAQEQEVLTGLLASKAMVENTGSPANRMRQSTDKKSLYNMSFDIGVDRSLLATEISRFK